jgi:hypothetical protein
MTIVKRQFKEVPIAEAKASLNEDGIGCEHCTAVLEEAEEAGETMLRVVTVKTFTDNNKVQPWTIETHVNHLSDELPTRYESW